MGWWSTDIMGGDTPLDFEDEIFDICGTEKFTDDYSVRNELTAESLEKNLPQILETLRNAADPVGFQVLGVLMMKAGATISPELKDEIVEMAKKDDWDEEERVATIQNFCQAVETYDGTPVVINSRGLFEMMYNFLTGEDNSPQE